MIPSAEVIATLAYLIPGFVFVKAFSLAGLGPRRTDLELSLWSLLIAAAINAIVSTSSVDEPWRLTFSIGAALVVGLAAGGIWSWIAPRFRWLRAGVAGRAWDVVLVGKPGPWVQIWTTDGRVIFGWAKIPASASMTDAPDLYVAEPSWVDAETQERTAMAGVDGVLIRDAAIQMIQVFT